jgi:putative hydrolase of the HAD superfamily
MQYPDDSRSPFFDPASVRAVVFDVGGVFLYPDWQRPSTMLDELGLPRPDDLGVFRKAHHAGAAALSAANRETAEHDPDFWQVYDDAFATVLGVPTELRPGFRVAIRGVWTWPHQENIDAFHQLHAHGLPTAIVSNNDGSAPEQMKQYGICWVHPGHELPRVAAIIDSSLVGVAKPDPAIMAPALHALGLPAEQVLYVGDTAHADIAGATNAGMQSVQLDPFDQHTDYDHARVRDLTHLNEVLGVI